MKKVFGLLILSLIASCANTSSVKPASRKIHQVLHRSLIKAGTVLLFGRIYNSNPNTSQREARPVFAIDGQKEKITANFEGKEQFFWLLVPVGTKRIHLDSIISSDIKYFSAKGSLATSQIAPTNQVPVYLGDIVLSTEEKNKNIYFPVELSLAQRFLRHKSIAGGNFVQRSFEGTQGLKDLLQRIH